MRVQRQTAVNAHAPSPRPPEGRCFHILMKVALMLGLRWRIARWRFAAAGRPICTTLSRSRLWRVGVSPHSATDSAETYWAMGL